MRPLPFSADVAARLARIEPFHAMEVLKHADRLRAQGRDIVTLGLGEPVFTAPDAVQQAAIAAMQEGLTTYSPALGLPELRAAIAGFHRDSRGLDIDPSRIVVTAGASGALLLACAALFGPGDEVLMPDPCYPCNRHFVAAFDAIARLVPTSASQRFALTAAQLIEHWSPSTRGVLIASPSNPTGTSTPPDELRAMLKHARAHGATLLVDEIYHGLGYGDDAVNGFAPSALELGDDVVTINSFSKFFGMTGWRLGWLVVPHSLVPTIEKLAQNLFICASTLSQRAALACFGSDTLAVYHARREQFRANRDRLLPALASLGFDIPAVPDGAFYLYADGTRLFDARTADADALCRVLLDEAGVVLVPGHDFGPTHAPRFIRASFAGSAESIDRAIDRLDAWITQRAGRAA